MGIRGITSFTGHNINPQPGAVAKYTQGLDSWTPFGQAGIGGMAGYVGQIRGNMARNQGQWFDQPTPSQATGEQSHDIWGPNPFGPQSTVTPTPGPLNTEGAMRSGEGMTHQQLGRPPSPKEIQQLQTALSDPGKRQKMLELAEQRGANPEVKNFLGGVRHPPGRAERAAKLREGHGKNLVYGTPGVFGGMRLSPQAVVELTILAAMAAAGIGYVVQQGRKLKKAVEEEVDGQGGQGGLWPWMEDDYQPN